MNLIINVISTEITLKREIVLDRSCLALKDVLRSLLDRKRGPWERIIEDDLSLAEGCVVLVNGRNIMSLEGFETSIHEGDEITFMVLVAGG